LPCSNRSTARRPTSSERVRPTPPPPFSRPASCSTSWARPTPPPASARLVRILPPARRRSSATASQKGSRDAHHAHREGLDERPTGRLGRRPHPHPDPHPPLRHRRVRGHPLLRDEQRPGRL